MPVRSGSSVVELGEETSVWSAYLAGTMTGTFLSKTESQRFLSLFPRAAVANSFALKSSTRLVVGKASAAL